MEKTVLFAFLAAFLLVGCGRNDNYIIPIDYEKYYEGKSDLTEAESQEINERIMTDMQRATIGKSIPDIKVKDIDGKEFRLIKLIQHPSVAIFSAHNSSWGKRDAEVDFPNAIRALEDEMESIDVFCLVENNADYDQNAVMDYAWRLQKNYSKVYLIDQKDAQSMNLSICPTKYFINEKHIVTDMYAGYAFEEEDRQLILLSGIYSMQEKL
ncbi:MAG: hypothetical protein MJZ97_11050 [Bacteroidales bacterium]|nr:hypothetical protein [Bacteroidales bacterium]